MRVSHRPITKEAFEQKPMRVVNALRKDIQGIPVWVEFVLIITICFGHLIYHSSQTLFIDASKVTNIITDQSALADGMFDIVVVCITLGFLKLRGWKLTEFLPVKATWTGLFLAVAMLAGHRFLAIVSYTLLSGIFGIQMVAGVQSTLSPIGVIATSIDVGFIEELIVLGYVTHVLQHRGPFFAITISTCIRLSYHLYQGPLVMIIVIPMGVLFGIIYWRYRNLWPFMLAHAFYDLMILAP